MQNHPRILLLAIAITTAACVDAAEPAQPRSTAVDLRATCGDMPSPEPGWAVVPGTYPGQSDRVCLPTDEYVARDQYLQALRDWASCAAFVGCRQRGGEASPNGCTK